MHPTLMRKGLWRFFFFFVLLVVVGGDGVVFILAVALVLPDAVNDCDGTFSTIDNCFLGVLEESTSALEPPCGRGSGDAEDAAIV